MTRGPRYNQISAGAIAPWPPPLDLPLNKHISWLCVCLKLYSCCREFFITICIKNIQAFYRCFYKCTSHLNKSCLNVCIYLSAVWHIIYKVAVAADHTLWCSLQSFNVQFWSFCNEKSSEKSQSLSPPPDTPLYEFSIMLHDFHLQMESGQQFVIELCSEKFNSAATTRKTARTDMYYCQGHSYLKSQISFQFNMFCLLDFVRAYFNSKIYSMVLVFHIYMNAFLLRL